MLTSKRITLEEVRFMSVGGTYMVSTIPKPIDWVSDKAWMCLNELHDKIERFKNIDSEFATN